MTNMNDPLYLRYMYMTNLNFLTFSDFEFSIAQSQLIFYWNNKECNFNPFVLNSPYLPPENVFWG